MVGTITFREPVTMESRFFEIIIRDIGTYGMVETITVRENQ
jgi:hypothetical protein